MRKTLMLVATAVLLTGTAMTGSAVARDRSDLTELTAGQITDQAAARAAQMKADLRLTAEQEKNWPAFEAAAVEMWKKQTEQQIACEMPTPSNGTASISSTKCVAMPTSRSTKRIHGRSSQTPHNRFTAVSTINRSIASRKPFFAGIVLVEPTKIRPPVEAALLMRARYARVTISGAPSLRRPQSPPYLCSSVPSPIIPLCLSAGICRHESHRASDVDANQRRPPTQATA